MSVPVWFCSCRAAVVLSPAAPQIWNPALIVVWPVECMGCNRHHSYIAVQPPISLSPRRARCRRLRSLPRRAAPATAARRPDRRPSRRPQSQLSHARLRRPSRARRRRWRRLAAPRAAPAAGHQVCCQMPHDIADCMPHYVHGLVIGLHLPVR